MNRAAWKRAALLGGVALAASAATFISLRAHAAGIPDAGPPSLTRVIWRIPDGTPVTGKKSIGLSLYAAETKGKAVCSVDPADVEPVSGRFQLALPDDCTDAVKANPDLWSRSWSKAR